MLPPDDYPAEFDDDDDDDDEFDDGCKTHLAPHLPGQGVDRLQGDGLEEERLTQSVARQPRVRDLVKKNI